MIYTQFNSEYYEFSTFDSVLAIWLSYVTVFKDIDV